MNLWHKLLATATRTATTTALSLLFVVARGADVCLYASSSCSFSHSYEFDTTQHMLGAHNHQPYFTEQQQQQQQQDNEHHRTWCVVFCLQWICKGHIVVVEIQILVVFRAVLPWLSIYMSCLHCQVLLSASGMVVIF